MNLKPEDQELYDFEYKRLADLRDKAREQGRKQLATHYRKLISALHVEYKTKELKEEVCHK